MAANPYISNTMGYGPGIAVMQAQLGWSGAAPLDALTPIRFALVQSMQFELDLKPKAAYGLGVFPVGFGSGQGSAKGKVKMLSVSGWALNAVIFGATATPPPGYNVVYNEPHTIPASTPFTVVQANAKQDLGVFYASLTAFPQLVFSQQLVTVASGPTVGQYSFTPGTGTYTFAAADAGKAIVITYASQPATPFMEQWQFPNQIQGTPPVFTMQFAPVFNGVSQRVTLPNCVFEKWTMPTKQGDWVEYEIDFQAFTSGESGNIMTLDVVSL